MSKILELREKRAKAWDAAKQFLDAKRGADGMLSEEDTATYDKMDPLHPSVDVAFDYIDLTLRSQTMYSSEPYRTGSGYRYKYGGYR